PGAHVNGRGPLESTTTRSVVLMKNPELACRLPIGDAVPLRSILQDTRVLVVEPQEDYRQEVTAGLRLRDAQVAPAATVAEALKPLTAAGPGGLVVDMELPVSEIGALHDRVHGVELRQGRRIPEVAMTPAAMLEAQQRARDAGFLQHVSRPVEPGRLAATI